MTQQATPAVWRGSLKTASVVKSQIAERWGEEEAEKYDPETNCFTFNTWRQKGYMVRKGEKALRSYTFIQEKEVGMVEGQAQEQVLASHPKQVCLFYYLQVEKRA